MVANHQIKRPETMPFTLTIEPFFASLVVKHCAWWALVRIRETLFIVIHTGFDNVPTNTPLTGIVGFAGNNRISSRVSIRSRLLGREMPGQQGKLAHENMALRTTRSTAADRNP